MFHGLKQFKVDSRAQKLHSSARIYLRVPQAAGQVKILTFLVKIKFFPMYANNFCDAGQVPISRYFEAWIEKLVSSRYFTSF